MKRFNLLSMVVAVVLVVAAVSCTPMRESGDDYYEPSSRAASNRVYVEDPYRGVVVLERDPYTGRYYEVNSYGSAYGNYYGNGRYSDRYYGRNSSGYGSRTYDSRYNRGTSQSPRVTQPAQQPTQEQIKEREKTRDEARRKVLGN